MAKFNLKKFILIEEIKIFFYRYLSENLRKNCAIIFFRNWVFQGALYMEWRELVFRISIELLTALVFFLLLSGVVGIKWVMLFSIMLAHTVMWVFCGHIWALSLGPNRRLARNNPGEILAYLNSLYARVNRVSAIKGCVVFGSLSQGKFTENSDLDILCCPQKGFLNCIIAFSVGMRERTIAFFKHMPVEIYFYDISAFEQVGDKERPILMKEQNGDISAIIKEAINYIDYPFSDQAFFSSVKRSI
jgi:hypothetical protein